MSETRFKMTKEHHSDTYLTAKNNGKVDNEFIPLCDYIEKTKEYFTTSSCAGRITLVGLDKEENKKESAFHRKWHRKVKLGEVKEGIDSFNGKILWFKQEPLIFHIGTGTIDNARKILAVCEMAGIKRAGIKVAKEGKFIIEMVGTHNITTPVKDGEIKISDDYLAYLVEKANEKYDKNFEMLKKFEKEVKKNLK